MTQSEVKQSNTREYSTYNPASFDTVKIASDTRKTKKEPPYTPDDDDEEMRTFIRREGRSSYNNSDMDESTDRAGRTRPIPRMSFSQVFGLSRSQLKGTYSLMAISSIFFLLTLFPITAYFILFNTFRMIRTLFFHTLVTSLVTTISILSFIFLLLILYGSGRFLEMRLGTKRFLFLYFGTALLGLVIVIAGQLLGKVFPNVIGFFADENASFTFQWTAMLGIMTYILFFLGINRETRVFIYFIPIRMKGKYILYFLLISNIIFFIIEFIQQSPYALSSLAQLAGILGGYLFYRRYEHGPMNAPTIY